MDPLDPHRAQRNSTFPRTTHKPQTTVQSIVRIHPMMIRTATGLGTRVRKTNPTRHIALIAVAKRFTAMNRVILIFNVGGFTMGFSG